ncbi:phosphoribosylformylglycinamidine synthase II, partial [bacterium]|nr:phosphoribosylformylglycinamidine synthase II [bacterium]
KLPALPLAEDAPIYQRPSKKPAYLDDLKYIDFDSWDTPIDFKDVINKLLSSPEVGSKSWIYTQYDHMVRTNTIALPGFYDAAGIRIKDTDKIIGMSLDCNPTYCYLNPERGVKIAVAESARNLASAGFKPLAITNCLNFGNPEDPEVMWQFIRTIDGIAEACETFNTPVTGGNVSFYNETKGKGIYPTPVIGMVGITDSYKKINSISFKNEDDIIVVLGKTHNEAGGSIYMKVIHNLLTLPIPEIDLQLEKSLQELMLELSESDIIESAHDISEGGLLLAALESSFASKHNLAAQFDINCDKMKSDIFLFSETQSRILLSLKPENLSKLSICCNKYSYYMEKIGSVSRNNFSIKYNNELIFKDEVKKLKKIWDNSLSNCFDS